MIRTQQSILTSTSIISLLFILNGCVSKTTNGTYRSVYSYHPYNNQYRIVKRATLPIYTNYSYYKYKPYQKPIVRYSSTDIAKRIESVAKSLLGTDYQYGANGPYQYDCSSFTKYVFAKNGITLPRTSKEQSKVGQYIPLSRLKKGDLIFFDSKKSSKVSHVGIYLGRGYFIHASSAKDQVTISNLNSNYYSKHFKWGRRVIGIHYVRR